MTRVLILGGDGMLGHKMFQRLSARYPGTECTIRGAVSDEAHAKVDLFQHGRVLQGVDVTDLEGLHRLLRDRRPEYVVNCVGVIKQRPAAREYVPSIMVNALLPHKLAEYCHEWGGRVIHFSTDCVFSGKKGAYLETDISDAEDLYGKTKFLGEVQTDNALTLRTSIIGRELANRKSLLEWFLGQNHGTVRGFTKASYSGVTTNHLADVVGDVIQDHPALSGLYQVSSGVISKHDLLCVLKQAFGLDISIVPDDSESCDRSMRGERFTEATGYQCPTWPELAAQLAQDDTPYESWR